MKFKFSQLLLLLLLLGSCVGSSPKSEKNESEKNKEMLMLGVRYYNADTDEEIEKLCTQEEAIASFKELPQEDGSFLVIDYKKNQAVQFMWQGDGRCYAEITNDSKEMIFRQRFVTVAEAADVIEATYKDEVDKLKGFVPVPIMEKTLEEVLNEGAK